MSVLEAFQQLKDQAVKADDELMAVAQKDEPTIQSKLDETKHEADQKAADLKASDGSQGHWQQIQADWRSHRERARTRLDEAKSGYDLSVSEADAESAEADAMDAIAFAASAILDAEQATLDALLARRQAEALASSASS
jgi:hypothetical protein